MNVDRPDSGVLYNIIQNLTSDRTKTKLIFAKCFDYAVYDKIRSYYNARNFFNYLRDNGKYWRGYLDRVNDIIRSGTPNYKQEIEDILSRIPERDFFIIDTIMKYTKKILDMGVYRELENRVNANKTKINLNFQLKALTQRDYFYYASRYNQYMDRKYIQHIFNKWKAPKFTIRPGVLKEQQKTPTTRVNVYIDDEKLQKIQQMIDKTQMKTLNNDKEILRNAISKRYTDENIIQRLFRFWENNMYNYLVKNNLKPRVREALLMGTLWVFLTKEMKNKINIEEFIKDPKEIAYVRTMYNKLSPTYFTIQRKYDIFYDNIRNKINDLVDTSTREQLISNIERSLENVKYKSDIINIVHNILKQYRVTKAEIREMLKETE